MGPKRKKERPSITYVHQLRYDTRLAIEELRVLVDDREEWSKTVKDVRVRSNQ